MNEIEEMMNEAYWIATNNNYTIGNRLKAMSVYAEFLKVKIDLMEKNNEF